MRSTFTALAATAWLCACSSTDTNPTMTLLRAGDAKVCVASDIEDSLRQLILPEGNAQAGKDYTISFDRASLESFDKVVAKAHCKAWVKVDGPDGTLIEPVAIDFIVSPSAQNADTFLVTAPTTPLRQRITNDVETRASIEESRAGEQAATAALEALVKPGWLIGRWVDGNAGTDACITGPYFDFGRKGELKTEDGDARWSMTGTQVIVTGSAKTLRLAITDADTNELTATYDDGQTARHRRCTRPELQAAAAAQRADEEEYAEGNGESEADATSNPAPQQ
ncbi:hypothetical protein [Sphingomonas sp. 1P08PE]|uniref:hypothetical protein n=1 Tax=Sphingomonas sp. 1P08PE TaxID=554122 RepID=UPI0039A124AF